MNWQETLKFIHAPYLRKDLPEFKAGDTIAVYVRIKEGDKERIQKYQGVVIQRRGSGATEMVTVRHISGDVAVERIFPIHSPIIERIEVISRGKVRRARLFYLRKRYGKAARIKRKEENTTQNS